MEESIIGVIGAMAGEISSLKESMTDVTTTEAAGMTFYKGRIGRTETVLVQSGIGKINAAVCAQILIDRFQVTHILNTGIAGSLDEEIDIGDVVISQDAVHHDMDVTGLGYPFGQVPGYDTLAFPADGEFVKMIADAVRAKAPEIRVFEGRVLSGDQFISSDGRKEEIRTRFGGLCCEMEGAAIAQTAWMNRVPFAIVRFISDKANSEASKTYAEIEAEASRRSAAVTAEVLRELGEG